MQTSRYSIVTYLAPIKSSRQWFLITVIFFILAPHQATSTEWPIQESSRQILLAKAGRKEGLIKQFRKATKLYDDRKFAKAAKIYARILKRFPEHGPSKIQLAKSYYRLEKISTAYGVFKTIDPKYLDPETAYERSQSFYSQKKYHLKFRGGTLKTNSQSFYFEKGKSI